MEESDLISRYPRLWHMAEDGTWDGIREHGLLSTSALLDLYKISSELRHSLESQRRPCSVTIERDGLPPAVIRDQKPIQEDKLAECLIDGLTPTHWYRILNARVFFWADYGRLEKMIAAYKDRAHTVLTIDTKSLFVTHINAMQLCPINSGATYYKAAERGLNTFLPVNEYRRNKIAEVVVLRGVPDIRDHVIDVQRI